MPKPAMPKPDPVIQEMLASIDKDHARLVSVIDDVLDMLVEQKLAWKARIPPKRVGVDKANRGGYGVSPTEVHALGSEIVKMGFSPLACAHAVCGEDDEDSTHARFTVDLASANLGLGRKSIEEIAYASVSCTHTNQWLCAALDGVECEYENLTIDGKMSVAKLSKDPKLADALQNGLEWLVLSAKVRKMYPQLMDLVQHARNAPGSAQRRETEMQLLVKVQHTVRSQTSSSKSSVDWNAIHQVISNRSLVNESDIGSYLKYVQLHGGGRSGCFIDDLDRFHKAFVPSGRVIPAATFQSIVDWKLQPAELCPWFASAIIKTQGSCPASKAANNVCRYVTASDISVCVGARKPQMLAAEKILSRARALVSAEQIPADVANKCLGRLDIRVARFVMKKEDKYTSIDAIGAAFVEEINGSGVAKITSPWNAQVVGSSSSDNSQNIIEYDENGNAISAQGMVIRSSGCDESITSLPIVIHRISYQSMYFCCFGCPRHRCIILHVAACRI